MWMGLTWNSLSTAMLRYLKDDWTTTLSADIFLMIIQVVSYPLPVLLAFSSSPSSPPLVLVQHVLCPEYSNKLLSAPLPPPDCYYNNAHLWQLLAALRASCWVILIFKSGEHTADGMTYIDSLIVCLGFAEWRFQSQDKATHYVWGSFRGEVI